MADNPLIKPAHKAIKAYYSRLGEYESQDVSHEGAVSSAFQFLLDETARLRGWILIPQQILRVNGRTIKPDGTLRDQWQLPHGYWEAKDTDDDLDVEIRKKIEAGYPLTNIIFEDSRQAVLFQSGQEAFTANLADPQALADLLNLFFGYTQPTIEGFEQAVVQFQERIPDLARGLVARIEEAHRDNRAFIAAFDGFYELCRNSLNPNLSRDAVDEMLVQHLLTERLIHRVFDNPDFVQRNVIAVEIEKVIGALTSQSFNRSEFLGALDHFYEAIEAAALNLEDFTEKQHFLNTVYERFFQGYSVRVADTHGIIYTPQEIVDFMCAAVEETLEAEFGVRLGAPGVHILDPCTGTGSFLVNLLRRLPRRDLPRVYSEQLFANEVMLMPYYVASLTIEHAYYELAGEYAPFEGLCFVDTLDLPQKVEAYQHRMTFISERNAARVEHEQETPITVIIGNPPYNVGQLNENDNNKNRVYDIIDARVGETYARDSTATNKNALYDAYVKFFRWATDRLGDRDGIVCFVSNNSFVEQLAFDGMRRHLMEDFTRIYHVDLHGNVRKNPKLSGTTHNVFGIQVGVGITVAVRSSRQRRGHVRYHRVPEFWRKEEKLDWLNSLVGSPPQTPPQGFGEGLEEGAGYAHAYTTAALWQQLKPLARQKRREQTPAEQCLWQRLRGHQVLGCKFRRQHPIDRFIVDFYCADARLVVEVDGPVHDYTPEEDAIRQEFLESRGLRVMRFANDDVLEASEGVVSQIAEALKSPPQTPPQSFGEGPGEGTTPLQRIPWQRLKPDARHTWLVPEHADEFAGFLPIGLKDARIAKGLDAEAVFKTFSPGVKTNRDAVVYDFNPDTLAGRVRQFVEDYNAEVDRYHRAGGKDNIDDFVHYDRVKWSEGLKANLARGRYAEFDESLACAALYRPFAQRELYFDDLLVERRYQLPQVFPRRKAEGKNIVVLSQSE